MRTSIFHMMCIACSLVGCGEPFSAAETSSATATASTTTTSSGVGGRGGDSASSTTSSTSDTASSGPGGGEGGSSSSTGMGGQAASSSSSGQGGSGGSPPLPVYKLHFILGDHAQNTYVGIGGKINQPNSSDTDKKVFVDAVSSMNCVAPSTGDNDVWCELGHLEDGTSLQLFLGTYNSPAGNPPPFAFYACDQEGFPSSDCSGEIEIYKDNVKIATFQDDNVAATPLPPPWSYVVADGFLEPFYPNLM